MVSARQDRFDTTSSFRPSRFYEHILGLSDPGPNSGSGDRGTVFHKLTCTTVLLILISQSMYIIIFILCFWNRSIVLLYDSQAFETMHIIKYILRTALCQTLNQNSYVTNRKNSSFYALCFQT